MVRTKEPKAKPTKKQNPKHAGIIWWKFVFLSNSTSNPRHNITRTSLVARTVENHLQCRRPGFNPWVRKIPWRKEWLPTPVFLPGESHGQRSREGCGLWGWMYDISFSALPPAVRVTNTRLSCWTCFLTAPMPALLLAICSLPQPDLPSKTWVRQRDCPGHTLQCLLIMVNIQSPNPYHGPPDIPCPMLTHPWGNRPPFADKGLRLLEQVNPAPTPYTLRASALAASSAWKVLSHIFARFSTTASRVLLKYHLLRDAFTNHLI